VDDSHPLDVKPPILATKVDDDRPLASGGLPSSRVDDDRPPFVKPPILATKVDDEHPPPDFVKPPILATKVDDDRPPREGVDDDRPLLQKVDDDRPLLYPENGVKRATKNKEDKEGTSSSSNKKKRHYGANTEASRYLFEKTGRKRWANVLQKEEFEKTEAEVGTERMIQAIDWALVSGISNIKSILTAARKGGHDAKPRPREQRPGVQERGQDPLAESRRRGLTIIEDEPGPAEDGGADRTV